MRSEAPKSTQTPAQSGTSSNTNNNRQRSIFISAAFSMSWQLALVVLIPVVGGYKLDQHLNTSPIWVLVGFLLAMVGVFLVLRKILKDFNQGSIR